MIYSLVRENWTRVEITHSTARSYYLLTHDSEFRERMLSGGAPFPFFGDQYTEMQKESCMVEMVMVWSVIMIESLINHAIAEKLNNKTSAVMAIEFPRQVTEKLKISQSSKSELAKKLCILADETATNSEFICIADELSEVRNRIVHDKPFEIHDCGDGEVKINHYRSRGELQERRTSYDDLTEFYDKCDKIKNYVTSIVPLSEIGMDEFGFSELMKDSLSTGS